MLLAHSAVVQAAAFGIENQVMGEMVHAAVTLAPGVQVGSHASIFLTPTTSLEIHGDSGCVIANTHV